MSRAHRARRKERRRAQKQNDRAIHRKGARRASPSVRTGILAAAIAGAAIVSILMITNTSSSRPATQVTKPESQTESEVTTLLKGIPQHGNTLGQPTAPITLQVFADLECEDARTFVVWLLPQIIHDWVRTHLVKIRYLSLKTDTIYPHVFLDQQAAALAAGQQNKMWNFIETFYHEQGEEYTDYATEEYLEGIASQVPQLDLARWLSARQNTLFNREVVSEDRTAIAWGFHSTPSFLLGRTGVRPTKLLGDQKYDLQNRFGKMVKLRYPVSFISSQILQAAIKRLPVVKGLHVATSD